MSENQVVHGTATSNQSTDKIEDSFRSLKLHGKQDGSAQSSPSTGRSGERDCLHYLTTGLCGYGSNCCFNHPTYFAQNVLYYKDELPERVGEPDCEYFLKTGTCRYGSACKYHHPKDRNGAGPVSFNILGFPMREGEKPCRFYMRTGTCKFGVACKFHHPQPVNGPSSSYGGSNFLSLGLPYAGGFTMMPMPTATYGTGPQAYVPVTVPSSQGNLPPQGWNTYLASVSSTYMVAPNPMYDVKSQADSISSAQIVATLNQNLPNRPDRPECQYFMNTGTCGYGADCKYHHPNERVSQLSKTATPVVLPSRPGQPICSNFSAFGFCFFGPNCKFDHSFAGRAYGLPIPSLSTYDPSIITNPTIPPTNHSSETSLSDNPNEENRNSDAEKPGENSDNADSELQISREHSNDQSD